MQKVKIFALLTLLALVAFPLAGEASFFVIEVDAEELDVPDLEAGDISAVLDSLLDNITAEIAPDTLTGMGAQSASPRIVHVGKVLIRASTFSYNIRDWIGEIDQQTIPVMHNAGQEFLQAYYQVARATGTYSLKQMYSLAGTSASIAGLGALMTANDSASATGFNDRFTEKYAIEDLAATTEIIINSTSLLDYGSVEPVYQQFANFTEANESAGALLGNDKVDDDLRLKTLVSGFDNVQDAVFEILAANIAANQSTPGDQIDPERITILEHDVDNANETDYLTANFANRARAVINNEFFEATSSMSFFGVRMFPVKTVVPAQAFLSAKALSAGLGKIVKFGKTIVSAPFRIASGLKKAIIDKPVAAIKATVDKGMEMGKSIIHKAINSPMDLVKTVAGEATKFVQKAAVAVTPMVSKAGELVTKGLSKVGGFLGKITDWIPFVIIGIAVLGIIGLIVYIAFFRPGGPIPA